MTGRGSGHLMRPNSNPSVTIGLSLSTSPSTLSASSEEPFFVVVTARILSSPHPERPITLWTHLSPLHALNTRAFENIRCTTDAAKFIEIWPRGWPNYIWDSENIRDSYHDPRDFVTIPTRDQGIFAARHQVPPDAIRGAKVEKGEVYRVKMTDLCLGTRWWTFGALEDLEGVRLRFWRSPASEEADAKEEKMIDDDSELREEIEKERRERFGDDYAARPSSMGEKHDMLAMVPELGEVEFKVI